MRAVLTLLVAAAATAAGADEVWLKGGRRLVGDVLEQNAQSVVLAVGPGTVRLSMKNVERVVSSTVALTEYRERAARLGSRDVAGWTALAQWAEQKDLRTQAREAWMRVLDADPGNAVAHLALGDVQYQGRWMDFASVQRARGLVEHDGVWMTRGSRDAALQRDAEAETARREAAIAESQRQEADARAREAEARARTAEAEAARAEAASTLGNGIPLDLVSPVIVGPVVPCCGRPQSWSNGHGHDDDVDVPPRPAPRPTPVPSDGGASPRVPTQTPRERAGAPRR